MKKSLVLIMPLLFGMVATNLCFAEPPMTDNPKILLAQVSDKDRDFAAKTCGIRSEDISTIDKLENKDIVRKLQGAITSHNCEALKAFKNTREFFKAQMATCDIIPPPKDYNSLYLTTPEETKLRELQMVCL